MYAIAIDNHVSKKTDLRTVTDGAPPPEVPSPLGFGESLVEGVVKINVLVGGAVSIILAIIVDKFVAGMVSAFLATLVGALLLWINSIVFVAFMSSRKETRRFHEIALSERIRWQQERKTLEDDHGKPVVNAAVQPYSPYLTAKCIFIVRWPAKSALPMGAQVTISTAESTHERPLGNGLVRAPQHDGLTVVTLDWAHDGVENIVNRLLDPGTRAEAIACIRIGPGYDLQGLSSISTFGSSTSRATGPEKVSSEGAP